MMSMVVDERMKSMRPGGQAQCDQIIYAYFANDTPVKYADMDDCGGAYLDNLLYWVLGNLVSGH